MGLKQCTIKNPVTLSGAGLHTGNVVTVTLKPAAENQGIVFVRTDLPNAPRVKANVENIHSDSGVPRCTSIGRKEVVIHTVEHLMSALCGLGIDNLFVEINGNELPGMDGSGLEFFQALKNAGIKEQDAQKDVIEVKEPICVSYNGSSILVVPADEFKISYALDYENPYLHAQFYSSVVNSETFETEIAPCRTFCLEDEAKALQSSGLGKGANYDNTLVVGKNGVIDNEVKFHDEFARHKVLDFIGDIYLLGQPLKGHVFAVKSGHALNFELVKKIKQQNERYQRQGSVPVSELSKENQLDIHQIMRVLPHRYPFLLVDRIVEMEKGKRAVGIKNVTMNENFFTGHFPSRPVMPGVLMVEAMAQTGGVLVLISGEHDGKLALFMAADNVKFRKVVSPGDQLVMEIDLIRDRPRTAMIHGVSKVNGEVVAEADMMFSFIDPNFLNEGN